MRREHFKISYVRKPFAKKSIPGILLAAAALIFCIVSLALSVSRQGQGGLNVAAWGFSSLLFAAAALIFGLQALGEKEANYLLAKLDLSVSGLLMVFWGCMILVGILGGTAN